MSARFHQRATPAPVVPITRTAKPAPPTRLSRPPQPAQIPRAISLRGGTLIEVLFAVALMATTALGLIAVELWTAREARAASLRERALFVADALVEISRAPSRDDAAYRLWASRASTMLPSGEAALDARGSGASVARVTWAVSHNLPPGDVIDKPESCGDVSVPAGSGCVALAFVP